MTTNKLTLTQYLNKFYKGLNTNTVYVDNYCSEVISDVEKLTEVDGKKLIIAECGLGKSVMVVNLAKTRKVLFLAPTVSIATQMADEYFAQTKQHATLLCSKVEGYITNKNLNSNLVIAVYDSLIKTVSLRINISEYVIFVDEVHQTVLATTYRQSAIDMMESLIGNNYITLTATPYSLVAEDYSRVLFIKRKVDKNRLVKFYRKQRNINTIEYIEHIVKNIKGKTIILCNNSKSAEDLSRVLQALGRKTVVVDASTNKQTRTKIVKEKKFPQGIDTIITTEALADGVSLYDTDITDMILMKQNINLNHLIQFPARARKSNQIVHYILAESRGKAEQIKSDINFNMFADVDVMRVKTKTELCNISLTQSQLKELFKHNRKFNKYLVNGEKYTVNNNLLAVDFFTRDDKLVNKVVIELFEYYGYTIEYVDSIKKEDKEREEKETNIVKYKDIEKVDKVNMVMSSLTGCDHMTNENIDIADYKKEITSVINKVKTILNIDTINPMQAHLYQDIVEVAVCLPNNFNKIAGIKKALDSIVDVDIAFRTVVDEIIRTGQLKQGKAVYTFIRDGKYVSKEEQKKIEEEVLWFYNSSINHTLDYDTFMKCIFKVELSDCRNYTKVISVLGKGELYLQGNTIKLKG